MLQRGAQVEMGLVEATYKRHSECIFDAKISTNDPPHLDQHVVVKAIYCCRYLPGNTESRRVRYVRGHTEGGRFADSLTSHN